MISPIWQLSNRNYLPYLIYLLYSQRGYKKSKWGALVNKITIIIAFILISFFGSTTQPMHRLEKTLGHFIPKSIEKNLSHNQLSNKKNKTLGSRPEKVQAAVNEAFDKIKEKSIESWLYNGQSCYWLLGFHDEDLLRNLALENNDKQDIYVMDVGCGMGDWGEHAMKIFSSEACNKTGKHFHIFNITGGKECNETVLQKNNVTLYQFNQFKMENIDEELTKRGFNLEGKFDLIVSNWTLRHLVDPFGTLKRIYNLLKPLQGMFMSNGFLFKFNDSEEIEAFPHQKNANILSGINAASLFRDWNHGRDVDQFLLVRNDSQELEIPLEYSGNICKIEGCQCASEVVTEYNKGYITPLKLEFIKYDALKRWAPGHYYYNKDDERKSKDLFLKLKKHISHRLGD